MSDSVHQASARNKFVVRLRNVMEGVHPILRTGVVSMILTWYDVWIRVV